jgi:hypothetical protein
MKKFLTSTFPSKEQTRVVVTVVAIETGLEALELHKSLLQKHF